MPKTIIALFKNSRTADEAVADLSAAGFDRRSISQASADAGEPHRSSLMKALTDRGVERGHAELYAEGVRRGGALVIVDTDDARVDPAVRTLDRHGSIDIEAAARRWREAGWTGFEPGATRLSETELEREREHLAGESFDVVEEEVKIGKRPVERGAVRVHTYISEQPVARDVELREEHVRVEREPAGERIPPGEVERAFEGGEREFVITEHAEEPVVQKEARVVERVNVSSEEESHTERVEDTERRRDVEVERSERPPR